MPLPIPLKNIIVPTALGSTCRCIAAGTSRGRIIILEVTARRIGKKDKAQCLKPASGNRKARLKRTLSRTMYLGQCTVPKWCAKSPCSPLLARKPRSNTLLASPNRPHISLPESIYQINQGLKLLLKVLHLQIPHCDCLIGSNQIWDGSGMHTALHTWLKIHMDSDSRFAFLLSLFTPSVILLVTGDSYLTLFFGWEGNPYVLYSLYLRHGRPPSVSLLCLTWTLIISMASVGRTLFELERPHIFLYDQ